MASIRTPTPMLCQCHARIWIAPRQRVRNTTSPRERHLGASEAIVAPGATIASLHATEAVESVKIAPWQCHCNATATPAHHCPVQLGCALFSKFLRHNPVLVDLSELTTRISTFEIGQRFIPLRQGAFRLLQLHIKYILFVTI